MSNKLFLIHWHEAEAQQYAEQLAAWGWEVVGIETEDGERGSKAVKALRPDVLVIYLTRLPSHGRETAKYLRSVAALQELPIIFVGGTAGAVTKTQEAVPDARYVEPDQLEAALAVHQLP